MPDFEPRPLSPPRVPIRGVYFWPICTSAMSRRLACFVDGFNLYHSLSAAQESRPDLVLKWLDLGALCRGFAQLVSQDSVLVSIDHFTAIPHHLKAADPARIHRHLVYLRALSAQRQPRIRIHEGRISRQSIEIRREGRTERWESWREKGTDVALAATVLELAQLELFDDAILVSGDTDYAPLAGIFARLHPAKTLRFALPFLREPRELRVVAPASFALSIDAYASSQMPEAVRLPSGKCVHCPAEWIPRERRKAKEIDI